MSVDTPDADRTVDVREIDGQPFEDIMAALDGLAPDESLLLINSFEPEPLYDVLDRRGFDYEATEAESGVWHVEIERAGGDDA